MNFINLYRYHKIVAMEIEIKRLSQSEVSKMGIEDWPIWEKAESSFNWQYDDKEQFYLIEGEVKIRTASREVEVRAGDFVTCPRGLACEWDVTKYAKKHYHFIEE